MTSRHVQKHATQGYVAGSMEEDARRLGRGGWIAGIFFGQDPDEALRTTDVLEVKYWSFPRGGGGSHTAKTSATLEWSMVLSGTIRAQLGDDSVVLQAGDYVLIHAGTSNNLVTEVIEDVTAVTVKSPSNPAAKTVLLPSSASET